MAAEFAEAEAAGEPVQVRWADAGPAGAEESWDAYRHDSGLSRTYEALLAPPGVVRDSCWNGCVAPVAEAPRANGSRCSTGRWTPAETATLVDREVQLGDQPAGPPQGGGARP